MTEQVVEFVELLNHPDYEILNTFPFTIRKKSNHYVVKESLNSYGYVQVYLNNKNYKKHRLIALQFLQNDDPDNKTDVDHINHDRSDYHIENLRWVNRSENCKNKSSYRGVNYTYVEDIDENAIVVDFYETRNKKHEFEGYYYHDGVFYYDNEMNYRILNVNETKCGTKFVCMKDIYGRKVSVYVNRFLQQHDLI